MLCDACLKIPPSLEPIRTGTLNYKSPWPDLVKDLPNKENPSPYDRLLIASLAERNLDQEIPNSQVLVPTDLDLELQPSLDELRKSSDLGCEGCLFWLGFVPKEIQDRGDVGIRIKALKKRLFGKIELPDLSMLRLAFVGPNLASRNTDDDKLVDLATGSLEVCASEG